MGLADRLYSIASAVGLARSRASAIGVSTGYSGALGDISISQALGDATVGSCVHLIAGVIAQLEFRAEDTKVDQLLQRPNDWQTRYEFFYSIAHDLKGWGNCFVRRFGSAHDPVALAPLEPATVQVQAGPGGLPQYLSVQGASGPLGPQDVIHLRDIPSSSIQSPARVQIGSARVLALMETDRFIAQHLRHGPSIRGVLSMPGAIDAKRQKTYTEQMQKSFAGDGERRGGVIIVSGGGSFTALDMPVIDDTLMQLRERLKAEVASLFGVPPFLAGAMEGNVKYSNQTAQHAAFYRDALAPTIRNVCSVLGSKLGSEVTCDPAGLLFGDMPSAIKAAREAVDGGLKSPNEGRALIGDPPVDDEGADRLRQSTGAQVGSMDPDRPRAGEDDDDEE